MPAADPTVASALLPDFDASPTPYHAVAEAVRASVGAKWAGHQINQVHFIRPRRSMSEIGG